MDISLVVNMLKELGSTASLSLSQKADIEKLYYDVLDKKFVPTSCNDCYHDAVIEMSCYLKKHGKMKEKREFKLKNGILLQMEFGSSEFYTNDNLTDDIAVKYLQTHPNHVNYFAQLPDDWEKRVNIKGEKGEIIIEPLVLDMYQSLKDGVSEQSILETFSSYRIHGRKISKKSLKLHLNLALEMMKKAEK